MTSASAEVDQVVFCLYPNFEAVSDAFDAQSDIKAPKEFASNELKKYYEAAQSFLTLEKYLWHDCGLQWKVVEGVKSPFQSFLTASVIFGDAMEDEWFCVKLLLSLTASFPELVASIFDSDGDFMLIEAAEALPRWLEPETSKNRVFIANGKVQIVSPSLCPSTPDLQTALRLVRTGTCAASESVQQIILNRAMQAQPLHKTRLRLSEKIWKLLGADEKLAGVALSAFYNRSPEDMQICTQMPLFNPTNKPQLEATFPLTRIQFAQLVCQEFIAPANEHVNFDMENAQDAVAAELGMKLTCGFEILMQPERETFLETNPFSLSCSVQERVFELLDSIQSLPLRLCNDPADSLDWMQVDEVDLQTQLNSAFSKVSLDADEEAELLDSWTAEYEGTPSKVNDMKREVAELDGIVEKMKTMLQSASNFEGVESADYDDDEDESDNSFASEDEDEDFIEREIFEAINFDPDLLMKIVEANAHMGADNTEFLRKFKEFQAENPSSNASGGKKQQKGLADIDPEKLAEARKSARDDRVSSVTAAGASESEEEEFDEDSDFENADDLIYGKTREESRREAKSEISDEEEDNVDFESYCQAMDAELQDILKAQFNLSDSQLKEALAKGVLQAAEASRGQSSGPVETVLASLKERLPTPK